MSEELGNFYANFYAKTQYTGAMGIFHDFYHKKLEKRHNTNLGKDILEIGGGYGEHLKHVKDDFNKYIFSDLNLDISSQVL